MLGRRLPVLLVALCALVLAAPARAYDPNRPRDWAGAPDGESWFRLGWELHQSERYEDAIHAFSEALEEDYHKPATMYNIACSFARLGKLDRSLEWIGRAIEAGFRRPDLMQRDPDLAALRGDLRFVQRVRDLRQLLGRDRQS